MKWIHGSAMEQRNKYERVELEGQKEEGTTETNSHSHSWCLRLIRPGNSRLGPVQFDTHITNHYPGHNRCTNVPTLLLLVKCTYFMHANILFFWGAYFMANIRTIYNITTNTSVPGQCNNNNTQQKGLFTQTVDK